MEVGHVVSDMNGHALGVGVLVATPEAFEEMTLAICAKRHVFALLS